MRYLFAWSDPKRWDWYAQGETNAVRKIRHAAQAENSVQRVLFETGLILLVPLALAALAQIVLGA